MPALSGASPRIAKKLRTLKVDGVFDIECGEWDRPALLAVLWANGDYLETRDVDEWYDALREHGGELWGHYAGFYDTLLVAETARKRGDRATFALQGPRVSRMQLGDLVLRDSHALVPMALEQAALMGNDKRWSKGELPAELFPCDCGGERYDKRGERKPNGCGGYCQIDPSGMSDAQWRTLSEYLRGDCDALLFGCLLPLIERAADLGIPLAGTIGGTAWASIQRDLDLPPVEWPHPSVYRLVEKAKRGGRCEIYRTRAARTYEYDVQSAYPAALEKVPVPVGDCVVWQGKQARDAFEMGLPGVYHATVNVPESHIPPLPTRVDDRPCYPWGRFRDAWALPELQNAVEHHGVEIVDMTTAVIWEDADRPLAPWMRKWWDERARTADDSPTFSAWLKWKINSATGKLGQDPRGETVVLHPTREQIKVHPKGETRCSVDKHYCGAWRIIADGMYAAPHWRIADHAYLHWNVYLTSAQRVEFHTEMVADGKGGETAVMGDTDSCYATVARTRNIGEDLGQWAFDGTSTDYYGPAPKAYTKHVETRAKAKDAWQVGKWVTRLKGVPRATEDDLRRYARSEKVVRDDGVMGLRSAARTEDGVLFQRKHLERAGGDHGQWVGSRILVGDGPITRAPHVNEVRSRGETRV